jgi:beta-mannosidase
VLDGFRDLNGAHRFGSPPDGSLVVELETTAGVRAAAVHALAGPGRAGPCTLAADLVADGEDWVVTLRSDRFAERVVVDVPGWRPEDNWFHLPPARPRAVRLRPLPGTTGAPEGVVRSVNTTDFVALRRSG